MNPHRPCLYAEPFGLGEKRRGGCVFSRENRPASQPASQLTLGFGCVCNQFNFLGKIRTPNLVYKRDANFLGFSIFSIIQLGATIWRFISTMINTPFRSKPPAK